MNARESRDVFRWRQGEPKYQPCNIHQTKHYRASCLFGPPYC